MRVALASKWYVGAAVAAACGGCQPPALVEAPRPAPAPVSVASVDPATVAPPPTAADAPAEVSQADVIGWAARGVTDDVILDRIAQAHSTFQLSAGDELRLRDAGVSDDVIRAMKASAWN